MKWIKFLLSMVIVVLLAGSAYAILGDLNKDGTVDFADFFLFADQFGKSGPPESPDTVVVVRKDTLERIIERTVLDTVVVVRKDTLERIIERTVSDTVVVVQKDTVIQAFERIVRDTVYRLLPIIDTVFVPEGTQPRLPIRSTWTEIVSEIRPSVYWIGYTARPTGDTRYDITFVGTGFATNPWYIVTNYHVGIALENGFKRTFSYLEPVAIAVRAGTRIFGDGTYFIGDVSEDRDLLAYWDERYDGTPNSPDLMLFVPSTDEPMPYYASLASLDNVMDLEIGEEIGILGFPGLLENPIANPYTLSPNPTFKSGTISTFRAYDATTALSKDWKIALLGKVLQHNLETSPGNSGSPIFNRRGEVIAIHNAGMQHTGDAYDFGIRADEIRLLLKAIYTGLVRPPSAKLVVGSKSIPSFPEPYLRPR